MIEKDSKKLSNDPGITLRKEPRYCLFEEVYPSIIQLFEKIRKEGFTEKKRVEGNKLLKIVFAKASDCYILVLSELFKESIVYPSLITEKTGIKKSTVQYYLEELRRYKIVRKVNLRDIPGINAGNKSRLVLYALPVITDDNINSFIQNSFPALVQKKYEEPVISLEGSMKTAENKRQYTALVVLNGRKICPKCGVDHGKEINSARFCNRCDRDG